jgi:ketosteroid isomerase-like protein
MIANEDQRAIRAVLAELERAWNALDFVAIGNLWDRSREPIYFAEEAPAPHLDWASLQAYWDYTARSIARMGMRITDTPQLRLIGPDLVSAIYAMHWDAVISGDPQPVGGDNRVCATLRRTADGWRFAQYVEAPLAPITYVKWLYQRQVTPGFA